MSLTAIAVSGGLDSLVAARILQEQGRDLIGVHFTTGYENTEKDSIQHIGKSLGIDIYFIDISQTFKFKVVDYFIKTYKNGQTPNPCLKCNPLIKFGVLWEFAQNLGANYLATGHYARVVQGPDKCFHLLKGADLKKDQSYFLAFLSEDQLKNAVFPLGNLTKEQVRNLADKKGLIPPVKKESQDVCFITGDYGDFLVNHGKLIPKPGPIVDVSGKEVGRHSGLHQFTVGQRKGIACPASEPYYVVRLDMPENRLIVGFKKDLIAKDCRVSGLHWIGQIPNLPIEVHVRLRYRHQAVLAMIYPQEHNHALIKFNSPQSAITPGQGAVFYKGEEVLGGAWIIPSN